MWSLREKPSGVACARRIFHPGIIVPVSVRVGQALIIACALAAAFAPVSSETIERVYSTAVYPKIQAAVTPASNAVSFAVFDVITVVAAIAIVVSAILAVARARAIRSIRPVGAWLIALSTAGAVAYLMFLGLWGLNYRRVPMGERLVLSTEPPSPEQVMELGFEAVRRINSLHEEAHRVGWEGDPRSSADLLDAFTFVQQRLLGVADAVPGRLKSSLYGPYYRWTTVDGMVDPFALEVLANPDLLPFERTFVAAHEWAHLAGFADEAEANFVGFLTCVRAGAPAQYSGWLSLYWQIGAEVPPDVRKRLWDAVREGPRRDIQAISDRLRRGQLPFLRDASWRVYDQYLRANRVEEGIRSYGQVINLVLRARFEDDWVPVLRVHEPSR
jgi:hypothetical protein